jgi:NADPH-dependent 2,4-dienoyl-CoA reductase/sulfur reductase-like enzyme
VVATGATERTLVFDDNDRPGVMLAGAVRQYLHRFGLAPERLVVFTVTDDAYRTAIDLHDAGVEVAMVVDARPDPRGVLPEAARARRDPVEQGVAPARARPKPLRAEHMKLDLLDHRSPPSTRREIATAVPADHRASSISRRPRG